MKATTISAWREHFGLSKNEVIRRTGLARNTVYKAEDEGLAAPATLIALANAFGISVSELLVGPPESRGYQQRPTVRAIPLYEGVPPMGWKTVSAPRTLEVVEDKITDPGMVAVVVRQNQMFPTLMPGDVVLVDPSRRSPADGDIVCVVDTRRNEGCLLRCRRNAHQVIFTGDNPMYPRLAVGTPDNIQVIGTVTRIVDRDLSRERAWWPKPANDVQEQH